MSTPRERIQSEIREALREGDKLRLSTLRMLLTSIQNEAIRAGQEVDEVGFLTLVRRGIKERREAAELYKKGSRGELAEKEEREAELLAAYLPPPVSEKDLLAAVHEIMQEKNLSGPSAIGPVMHEMMARFRGVADGGTIRRLASQVLSE